MSRSLCRKDMLFPMSVSRPAPSLPASRTGSAEERKQERLTLTFHFQSSPLIKSGWLEDRKPRSQGEFHWVSHSTPHHSHQLPDYGVNSSILQSHSSSLGVKLGLTLYLLLHRKVNTSLIFPLLPSDECLH